MLHRANSYRTTFSQSASTMSPAAKHHTFHSGRHGHEDTYRRILRAFEVPVEGPNLPNPGINHLNWSSTICHHSATSPRFLNTMVNRNDVPGLTSPVTTPDCVTEATSARHSLR